MLNVTLCDNNDQIQDKILYRKKRKEKNIYINIDIEFTKHPFTAGQGVYRIQQEGLQERPGFL